MAAIMSSMDKIKLTIKKSPLRGKFGRDVFWNYVSFAVLGASGIAINILIGKIYGAEDLGAFNQVYAAYVLLSQLSVGALHLSVVAHVSQFAEEQDVCNSVISSAFLGAMSGALCRCMSNVPGTMC